MVNAETIMSLRRQAEALLNQADDLLPRGAVDSTVLRKEHSDLMMRAFRLIAATDTLESLVTDGIMDIRNNGYRGGFF